MRSRWVMAVAVMICSLFLASFALAQDLRSMPLSVQGGEGRSGQITMEVNMDDVPAATADEMTPHIKMLRPRDGRTDKQYAEMKRQAELLSHNGVAAISKESGAAPSQRSGSIDLATSNAFLGQSEVCCTPSDMAVAVGPTYVAQFVNSYIAVYTKTGVLQTGYPKSATKFFGLKAGTYTTDPRGFYDQVNNRYVFVMLTESSFSSNNVGQLMVAVSKTNSPKGSWNIIKFQVGNTGECPDYPTLGHDTSNWGTGGTKGAIYIGINQFSNNCNGGFINNYLFMIPKDNLYAGTGYYLWYFSGFTLGGTLLDTLSPASPQGPGDRASAEYVTNTLNMLWNCGAGCGSMVVLGINNVAAFTQGGPSPVWSGVVVPTAHTYYYPPSANQPGAPTSIETIDVRITGAMYYHAGHLFGSFETGVPAVTGAHPIWFDTHPVLDLNSNVVGAEERQEDCFYCGGQGTNGSAYFATLAPDSENNLTMTYTFSDDNTYPEMVVTGRRVSYGDSLMNGAGYYIVGGSGYYGQGRWGDYSAVSPDNTVPSNPLMWTAGDYDNGGNWGTAISAQNYPTAANQ